MYPGAKEAWFRRKNKWKSEKRHAKPLLVAPFAADLNHAVDI